MQLSLRDSARDDQLLNEAVGLLSNGCVAIFPTETIYGIGCSALQTPAIHRVFSIKGRAPDQPPPLLIADEKQLQILVAHVPQFARDLMTKYWPGALTLVLPARDDVAAVLCGYANDKSTRTVGVRMTAHPIARVICQKLGAPLVATSANFSGASSRAAAPQTLDDIPETFKAQVEIIIDGGAVGSVPSTVVDCSSHQPRLLRAGAVPFPDQFHDPFHDR